MINAAARSLPPSGLAGHLPRPREAYIETKSYEVTHNPDALRYWCSRRQDVPLPVRSETAEAFKPRKPRGDMEGYLMGGYGGM